MDWMYGCCMTPVGKWIVAGDRNLLITNRNTPPPAPANVLDTATEPASQRYLSITEVQNVACAIDGLAPTTSMDSLFVPACQTFYCRSPHLHCQCHCCYYTVRFNVGRYLLTVTVQRLKCTYFDNLENT